jgi:excisionase family DNA binding protein
MSTKLYTVNETAERLNTTPRFVRRLISERRIPFVRLGKHIRIAEEDVEAFITAGRVETMRRGARGRVA